MEPRNRFQGIDSASPCSMAGWFRVLHRLFSNSSTRVSKQSFGARNRVGIKLSYRSRQATQPGGISSLESILGLLKTLKLWLWYFKFLRILYIFVKIIIGRPKLSCARKLFMRNIKISFHTPCLNNTTCCLFTYIV